jgi:hypothetical protein
VVAATVALATGCGTASPPPKEAARSYLSQIHAVESELVQAARSRSAGNIQRALADGESALPRIKPPPWARADHDLLTREWAKLTSDAADARAHPGVGFEVAARADVRRISATTARLAAAASAHGARLRGAHR